MIDDQIDSEWLAFDVVAIVLPNLRQCLEIIFGKVARTARPPEIDGKPKPLLDETMVIKGITKVCSPCIFPRVLIIIVTEPLVTQFPQLLTQHSFVANNSPNNT